jgi:hypothetical protein
MSLPSTLALSMTMVSRKLASVEDLVVEILAFVDAADERTLRACALVHRVWRGPAQARLCSRLALASNAQYHRLFRALRAHPALGTHVRGLVLTFSLLYKPSLTLLAPHLALARVHTLELRMEWKHELALAQEVLALLPAIRRLELTQMAGSAGWFDVGGLAAELPAFPPVPGLTSVSLKGKLDATLGHWLGCTPVAERLTRLTCVPADRNAVHSSLGAMLSFVRCCPCLCVLQLDVSDYAEVAQRETYDEDAGASPLSARLHTPVHDTPHTDFLDWPWGHAALRRIELYARGDKFAVPTVFGLLLRARLPALRELLIHLFRCGSNFSPWEQVNCSPRNIARWRLPDSLTFPLEAARFELEPGHTTMRVVGAEPFLELFGGARQSGVLTAEWNGAQFVAAR